MEQDKKIDKDEHIKIPGFSGPHINRYLGKHSVSKGKKKFNKLDQAIEAAKLDKYCSGITRNHKGYYTLRKEKYLLHSHTNNKNLFQEISWLKIYPPNHTILQQQLQQQLQLQQQQIINNNNNNNNNNI